ncbi:MAG: methylmalonyl-CoA carboxyltransferase [Actinomycetales bacterium]|nr:MAG: methylmalonyl-CoA carboxyltransferase [Actinomycetales bacterium]
MQEKIDLLHQHRAELAAAGGEKRIAKQHEQGKLTARERIDQLLDPESFQETTKYAVHRANRFGMQGKEVPSDGVVVGQGTVFGRLVHVASQDFTILGGTIGELHAEKIAGAAAMALHTGSPFICINDSGGARVQEGVDALHGCGQIFYHNVLLSGVVPQVSILAGPCAGAAAYSPALTDFIIQTQKAQMYITGPDVIKQVTGETVSHENLGGAAVHAGTSGVVHFVAEDDEQALLIAQKLLSFLPQNNTEDPPELEHDGIVEDSPFLNTVIPEDPRRAYDVRDVIANVVDDGDFLEVHASWAINAVVGFGRMVGRTVGVIANQPNQMSGVLDINASDKIARFVRFCNAFNIPLLTFVDTPGFMPGVDQEYNGIIRHGAKVLFAYSAATVPKVTVVMRKAFGGAYIAMCARALGADRVFAWPSAEIAVMGAEGAAGIVFRKEIAAADDPGAKRQELIDTYRNTFANPYVASEHGLVDDVIEPAETRRMVAQALEAQTTKRDYRPPKKHGLIPM